MKRLLLVAYQCGPGMGSVSQIGWEWYQRLSAERCMFFKSSIQPMTGFW